jgi:hypothetical protein
VKTSTIVYVLHSIKDALNLKSHLAELKGAFKGLLIRIQPMTEEESNGKEKTGTNF